MSLLDPETIELVPEFSPAVLAAIDIDGEMPRDRQA